MKNEDKQEKKGLKFPMVFDKCPICGSKKRLIQTAMEEEGYKNTQTALQTIQIGLVDQVGLSRPTIPVLRILIDACINPKCGALYITSVEKQVGAPQRPGQRPGQMPPGLGELRGSGPLGPENFRGLSFGRG